MQWPRRIASLAFIRFEVGVEAGVILLWFNLFARLYVLLHLCVFVDAADGIERNVISGD